MLLRLFGGFLMDANFWMQKAGIPLFINASGAAMGALDRQPAPRRAREEYEFQRLRSKSVQAELKTLQCAPFSTTCSGWSATHSARKPAIDSSPAKRA